MRRIMLFFPVLVFLALGGLLFFGLSNDPNHMPSAREGHHISDFRLPDLLNEGEMISNDDIKTGDYVLLNFWGTWCPSCRLEHPFLVTLRDRGVDVVGVDYKDEVTPALEWLTRLGNPYSKVIFDGQGTLGFDLGVTGAPETFLISPEGVILLRYQGPLDQNVWEKEFVPLMK